MCSPQLLIGYLRGKAQHFRLVNPMGHVSAVEFSKPRMGPRTEVHAICDRAYSKAREDSRGRFRMSFGDTVHIAAEIEGQTGHIERVGPSQALETVDVDEVAQKPLHCGMVELVKCGLDWRMGGEDAPI